MKKQKDNVIWETDGAKQLIKERDEARRELESVRAEWKVDIDQRSQFKSQAEDLKREVELLRPLAEAVENQRTVNFDDISKHEQLLLELAISDKLNAYRAAYPKGAANGKS